MDQHKALLQQLEPLLQRFTQLSLKAKQMHEQQVKKLAEWQQEAQEQLKQKQAKQQQINQQLDHLQ